MDSEIRIKKCRLCGKSFPHSGLECDACWEVYSRLRDLTAKQVILFLKEAGMLDEVKYELSK